MKVYFRLFLLCLIVSCITSARAEDKPSNIADQTSATQKQTDLSKVFMSVEPKILDLMIKYVKNVLVVIHDDKELSQEEKTFFYELALKKMEDKIVFAHISTSEYPQLNSIYSVTGPLTVCLFIKQKIFYYRGNWQDQQELSGWIDSLIRLKIKTIKKGEIEQFESLPGLKLHFCLKENDTSTLAIVDEMIQTDVFIDNGVVDLAMTVVDAEEETGVYLLKQTSYEEPKRLKFNLPLDYSDFLNFIQISSLNLINDLDEKTYERIFSKHFVYQVHLFLRSDPEDPVNRETLKQFEGAAYANVDQKDRHTEQAVFVKFIYNQDKTGFQEMFDIISESSLPQVAITEIDYLNQTLHKYLYPKDMAITAGGIIQFLEDARAKKIAPFYRSEHQSDEENANLAIKKGTGQNFDKLVLQSNKSALILFWSSKNKQGFDIYYQLLANLTKELDKSLYESKLVLATYDLDLNEHEEVGIENAPAIIFYVRGTKQKPIKYNGDYNLDTMKKFISQWDKEILFAQPSSEEQKGQSEQEQKNTKDTPQILPKGSKVEQVEL